MQNQYKPLQYLYYIHMLKIIMVSSYYVLCVELYCIHANSHNNYNMYMCLQAQVNIRKLSNIYYTHDTYLQPHLCMLQKHQNS